MSKNTLQSELIEYATTITEVNQRIDFMWILCLLFAALEVPAT